MTSKTTGLAITHDTHDLGGMTEFYTVRLGFESAGQIAPGPIYETHELRHPGLGVVIRLRDCTPKPPAGSSVGTLWSITLKVTDPEAAAEGLAVQRREPAEGPADLIVVRHPTNYQVYLERA